MTTTVRPKGATLWGLVLTLLLGSLTLVGCSSGGGVTTVTPHDWLTAAAKPGVVVVDVRTPAEYAAGHVQGAVNLDVQAADFTTKMNQLDKTATYAIYCHSGNRSAAATTAMGKAGFSHVYNLKGGIADLQSAGAPIVAS
ncbi:rhodanese-like domain-containing protein [Raineyella fluvialis]|uniref:Rhodanese-like domain-containing protein n=1 Tax=Raineyella fluvialis TaxID=2662261 RepID=A0A5Q2FBF6_9ACTN|nr:rhodanese-like domain-containing protein [Raineyella fluvialis]QGF23057.1 rhodanese-like domain-containing protein [Raineyella fluvialis]